MSILLKTSKKKKILVVENKNKNGVIESPKQKNLAFLFMLTNCNKGLRISPNISQGKSTIAKLLGHCLLGFEILVVWIIFLILFLQIRHFSKLVFNFLTLISYKLVFKRGLIFCD